MPTVVQPADLPSLLSWLKNCLPQSFKVYKDLQSFLAGGFVGVQFVVDRWPEPQALVEIPDASDKENELYEHLQNKVLGVCGENEVLLKLLLEPGLINWNIPLTFCGVANQLWETVKMASVKLGGMCLDNDECYVLKADPKDLVDLPVPEGMTLVSAREDWASTVNSTWKYGSSHSFCWVKFCTNKFPSAVLLTHSNQHVGHMIVTTYSSMGMLYVQPEFRRQGLAKVIVSNLAKKCFDQGEEAFVIVEELNFESLKVHKDIGFKCVPDFKIAWLSYKPKSSCITQNKECCM